jgi:hypothetical protein
LQPDPIGYSGGGLNLYAYVGNDAPNQSDPLGLFTLVVTGLWIPLITWAIGMTNKNAAGGGGGSGGGPISPTVSGSTPGLYGGTETAPAPTPSNYSGPNAHWPWSYPSGQSWHIVPAIPHPELLTVPKRAEQIILAPWMYTDSKNKIRYITKDGEVVKTKDINPEHRKQNQNFTPPPFTPVNADDLPRSRPDPEDMNRAIPLYNPYRMTSPIFSGDFDT